LNQLKIAEIKMLASQLRIDSWQKAKAQLIPLILEAQNEIEPLDERIENFCEMCGNFVAIRQKAHIVAELDNSRENILMLCPTCHLIFDTRLKPRLYNALSRYNVNNLPESWKKSIYMQAYESSSSVRKGMTMEP